MFKNLSTEFLQNSFAASGGLFSMYVSK